MLLGRYENFPDNVHNLFLCYHNVPSKSLQQTILCTFYRLNKESFDLGAITPFLRRDCKVSFEFGIANGFDFNFLDQNELVQCLKVVEEKEVRVLDFFCAIRYHVIKEGKKVIPLRFDYHINRFIFHDSKLETRIRHEKGIRRVPVDEFMEFVVNQINIELSKVKLNPLVLSDENKVRKEFSD
jgi:hypothetical protein